MNKGQPPPFFVNDFHLETNVTLNQKAFILLQHVHHVFYLAILQAFTRLFCHI
jgi:hypothetical protein